VLFLSVYAPKAAPFTHRKLGLAEQFGELVSRVEVPDCLPFDQYDQHGFHLLQLFDDHGFIHNSARFLVSLNEIVVLASFGAFEISACS
jgi:hypothetical protein